MSKSVTVKFEDGTSHVYDEVPDDVTDQQVQERASSEFGKKIAAVNPPTPTQVAEQKFNDQSMMERVGGAVTAGANLAGQALTSPLGHVLEAAGAVGYLGNKLAQRNAPPPASPPVAAPVAPQMQTAMTGTGPSLNVVPGGQAPVAPTAPPATATAAPAPMQPSAGIKPGSMLDNASQIVRKLALSKLLPAAQVGAGLFYTSPEEIAVLKAAEERRRRAGQPQ